MNACFMGLGYIGLPTAIIAAKHGVKITGVDINQKVVDMTNQGKIHIVEPGLQALCEEVVKSGMLKASTTPVVSDAYFIVVPTPFKGNHEPDISYVQAATEAVIPFLKEGDLYVIESTSPVGTTDKMEALIFEKRPELKGKIYIAYCPERVLPGNVIYELVHNDRVIGGINPESTEKAMEFYGQFVQGTLHKTNAKTAEMCKLTENSSRDVQIAFANELSLICDKAGINVWELIALANKHPRVNILWPGCGVGGHCIAVDPYFLTADFPVESQLIAKAREINNYKSFWCAERVQNEMLKFELKNGRKPVVAMKDLRLSPILTTSANPRQSTLSQKLWKHATTRTSSLWSPTCRSTKSLSSRTIRKHSTTRTSSSTSWPITNSRLSPEIPTRSCLTSAVFSANPPEHSIQRRYSYR